MSDRYERQRVYVVRSRKLTVVHASLPHFRTLGADRKVTEVLRACSKVHAPKSLETRILLMIRRVDAED